MAHSQGTIIASDVLWKLWVDVDHGKLPEASLSASQTVLNEIKKAATS